jgi:hypothetical protein
MVRVSWGWAVGCLSLAVACGGGGDRDETASGALEGAADALSEALDTTLPDDALAAPEPFYRITLEAERDGTFQIRSAARVVLDRAPLPGFVAEHMLVSRASDGRLLDAVAIAFPTTGHDTVRDGDQIVHDEFALQQSAATAFLPASAEVDHIELVNPAMDVAVGITAADILAASAERPDASGSVPKLSSANFQFLYRSIALLGPGDEERVPAQLFTTGSFVPITDAAFDIIADGLQDVMPIALNGVRHIGVVHWSAGSDEAMQDLLGRSVGPYIVFSDVQLADNRRTEEAIQTVVHETAHSFAALTSVGSGPGTPATTAWPKDVLAAASSAVKRFELVGGIYTAWAALHDAGVKAGYATDYLPGPDAWRELRGQQARILDGGFAAAYGSSSPREDLATYVATLQHPTDAEPGPCARFGGSRLDIDRATTYAKLVLLRGVGVVSDENFSRCVQGTTIQPAKGVNFGGNIKFQDSVQAGKVGQGSDTEYLVLASGANTYKILIQVALQADKSPLGLHLLEPLALSDIGSDFANQVLLDNADLALSRASEQGFVLVSEYTTSGSKGAVFGLVLDNAFGTPIEFWPFGTFSGSL